MGEIKTFDPSKQEKCGSPEEELIRILKEKEEKRKGKNKYIEIFQKYMIDDSIESVYAGLGGASIEVQQTMKSISTLEMDNELEAKVESVMLNEDLFVFDQWLNENFSHVLDEIIDMDFYIPPILQTIEAFKTNITEQRLMEDLNSLKKRVANNIVNVIYYIESNFDSPCIVAAIDKNGNCKIIPIIEYFDDKDDIDENSIKTISFKVLSCLLDFEHEKGGVILLYKQVSPLTFIVSGFNLNKKSFFDPLALEDVEEISQRYEDKIEFFDEPNTQFAYEHTYTEELE